MAEPTALTARLAELGATIRTGVPATDEDIAALADALRCRFPSDYRAFLRSHGALHVHSDGEDVYVFGHAPEDAELDAAAVARNVTAEFESWGQARVEVCPILGHAPIASSFTVLGADGTVRSFDRGVLEEISASFSELLTQRLYELVERHTREAARREAQRSFFAAFRALVPPEILIESHEGRCVLRRPDGVLVTVRFGDGRELGGNAPAIFASWEVDRAATADEVDAWNHRASFVIASRRDDRVRYRGRLPADGLPAEVLAFALARDAGLALRVSQPRAGSIDDLVAALAGAGPTSPEDRLLEALMGGGSSSGSADRAHRVGDEVLIPGAKPSLSRYPDLDLRASIVDGLVHVRAAVPTARSRSDLLAVADAAHACDDPQNDDLQPFVRVLADGDGITLGFTTALVAIPGPAWIAAVRELNRAAGTAALPTDVGSSEPES